MGKDRFGADAQGGVRAVKPPPDRLYGRSRGHKLRPRQEVLLDVTLPRLLLRELPSGPYSLRSGLGAVSTPWRKYAPFQT